MEERRYFWHWEINPFDVINLPEFTLLEGVLIVSFLAVLGLYLMLIVLLESREKRKAKRVKQLAWLSRWLEHLKLDPGEEAELHRLAGSPEPLALQELLSSPAKLEFRLHEALSTNQSVSHRFAEKLRDKLGYTSRNLRIPVVSTRQLVAGDPVRISFATGGTPHHYYGKVLASGNATFAVEIHPDAVKILAEAGSEADIFYIRALGLEYPFTHVAARAGKNPDQMVLKHTLARTGPRAARLPLMLELRFRQTAVDASPVDDLDPDKAGSAERNGQLLDISTGGFCLGHKGELIPGDYIEIRLPLKRRGRELILTGRVVASRPFTSDQWLSRCELRGMDSAKRKLLGNLLKSGQASRLRMPGLMRGNKAKAG